jgi:hypothetical protein
MRKQLSQSVITHEVQAELAQVRSKR